MQKFRPWGRITLLGLSALALSLVVTVLTIKLPMFYTDRYADTYGRIVFCGWPIPWLLQSPFLPRERVFDGLWILPINWSLWLAASVWFCGFRARRSFLKAYFVLLLLFLSVAVGGALITDQLTVDDIVFLLSPR